MIDSDPVAIARSRGTSPGGQLLWTFLVTDQLVDAVQDWSPSVQFRFEKLDDGTVEMLVRTPT